VKPALNTFSMSALIQRTTEPVMVKLLNEAAASREE
jgi:hypothetical protein